MNREILFRGKRTDNGEWAEGQYVNCCYPGKENETGHFIVEYPNRYHEVYTSTVCQYTGLTDKNGKRIWEKDIVWVTDDDGNTGMVDTGLGEIDFLEGLWYISGSVQNSLYDINKVFQIEVIGNIFDQKELLEVEHE